MQKCMSTKNDWLMMLKVVCLLYTIYVKHIRQRIWVTMIMTNRALKNPLIIFFSFCLYIIFSVYYFNTVGFTAFDPASGKALPDAAAASLLVCFLFMFVSTFAHRKSETSEKEDGENTRVPFLFETIISGFFFAAGSYFCLAGITVDEALNNKMFSWSQLCFLSLLMLSVVIFYIYFRFEKKAFLSFIGYVLTLLGLLSLYYGGYSDGNVLFVQLGSLFLKGNLTATPVTEIIIAGIFWIICINVNQSISSFHQQDLIWTQTLFFGFLISTVGVIFYSFLYNRDLIFYLDFHYESIFFYACFLFFYLQCYLLILKSKDWLSKEETILKTWVISILLFNLVLCLCFHKDFPFMIKNTILCLGIYYIWSPVVHFEKAKFGNKGFKTALLLFLGFVLTGCVIGVVFQIFLYGIWLQDTFLWKYIVFFEKNGYACIFLLSLPLTAFLTERYPFRKVANIMCRGIVLCIMVWLVAAIVQETIMIALGSVTSIIKLGWWEAADDETKGMWLGILLMASSFLSLIFSVWQCKKGIGRIIVWTLLGNMMLYKGVGLFVGHGLWRLCSLNNIVAQSGVNDKAWLLFFLGLLPYLVMFALLGLSGILICFTKVEQSVLPGMMGCRRLGSEEEKKLEEISSIIFDKTGIPISAYHILICQRKGNRAFSIGRNTVALTKSLVDGFSVNHIAGLIAHELGHLRQKDGHYQFVIDALNLPVHLVSKIGSGLLTGQKRIALFMFPILFILVFSGLLSNMKFIFSRAIFYVLLQTAVFIIQKQDFRESEFTADSFAREHGLGQDLKAALLQIGEGKEHLSLWELIISDYPSFPERIKRLDALS